MFQKTEGRRWTWKSPNGTTTTEIVYILINRPDIVTNVTVINQVNIESDHSMVVSNIKLDVEVEMKRMMTKSRYQTSRIKEDRIITRIEESIRDTKRTRRHRHHERNHYRHDPTKRVKTINKPLESRISLPSRSLMTKLREMVENDDDKQRIKYA